MWLRKFVFFSPPPPSTINPETDLVTHELTVDSTKLNKGIAKTIESQSIKQETNKNASTDWKQLV